ncbi:MAG: hypothetical protein M3539_17125 [Acidobacteriota bacterium]|nr:hypothetical protein [Acidobacteriota bacterium]
MDDYSKLALTVLASGAGAAIAGYFGAFFGAKKFRNEKAFEDRLEWYKKTATALRKIVFDIDVANTYQSEGDATGNWLVVREDGYIPLVQLIDESAIFATPFGVEVMEDFGRELEKVSEATDCFQPEMMSGEEQLNQLHDLQVKAAETRAKLATDMRKHLGLEKLG